MKRPRQLTTIVLTLVTLASILAAGCNSSSSSPTAPQTSLVLQAESTATQDEPGAFRIQLRMEVVQGLAALRQASQTGAATAQTCLAEDCAEGPLTADFMEAVCGGLFGSLRSQAELGFGTAWLNGEVVGVDFCVSELTEGVTFETTILDGARRSNTIQTNCGMDGGLLICASN